MCTFRQKWWVGDRQQTKNPGVWSVDYTATNIMAFVCCWLTWGNEKNSRKKVRSRNRTKSAHHYFVCKFLPMALGKKTKTKESALITFPKSCWVCIDTKGGWSTANKKSRSSKRWLHRNKHHGLYLLLIKKGNEKNNVEKSSASKQNKLCSPLFRLQVFTKGIENSQSERCWTVVLCYKKNLFKTMRKKSSFTI